MSNEPGQTGRPRVVVIGIGNEYGGDDALGRVVALRLSDIEHADVTEIDGISTNIMQAWEGYDVAVLVDAVRSGSPPGRIHRMEAHDGPLPHQVFGTSTHGFGVAEAVELARALGTLPGRVLVYGVEGRQFEQGAGMSAEVEGALDEVTERVRTEIAGITGG